MAEQRKRRVWLIATAATLAVVAVTVAFAVTGLPLPGILTGLTGNPFQRGPDPTQASIAAATGPFTTASSTVPAADVTGFGGGTIYYPTGEDGSFGAVAISPGFTGKQSSVAWLGPRLASQGFVVMTIDTLTLFDPPASRGSQLRAALAYLAAGSPVKAIVDPKRTAVMGHSMGGGGALQAALDQPTLKAAIGLTPWNLDDAWQGVQVPTLLIGAQQDLIAPVDVHARAFYASLPAKTPKEYVEIAGAGHLAPTTPSTTVAKQSIAFLKRFVDGDTRYTQFLCPTPTVTAALSRTASSCPF